MELYNFEFKNASDEVVSMSDYKDKTLIIVNTASACGLTGQYEGLEELYEKYRDQGLEVLGFPCNQFGGQEPGTDQEIQTFCQVKFGVEFPVFQKINVNGKDAHPLYDFLKEKAPGLLGTKAIKWNFTKFLVSKDGTSIKRFAPKDEPSSMIADIEKLLN
ncbi:MAG: glutathione peroxidase [Candidatus Cloacimonetes bacterium]|nr:glutathione peroxidase [Candidatus Cloacimonadota bacterium]